MLTLAFTIGTNALQITLIGIGVVFLVLGLLWLVLTIMNWLFEERPKVGPPAPDREVQPEKEPAPEFVERPIESRVSAAILAAVIASTGFIPKHIEIRRWGVDRDRQKTAAVIAATLATLDSTPKAIHIQKV